MYYIDIFNTLKKLQVVPFKILRIGKFNVSDVITNTVNKNSQINNGDQYQIC